MECTSRVDTSISQKVQVAYKILEQHKDHIRAVINTHINNSAEADDIFQNFFLSLVNRPIPVGLENVRGYLTRAIKNDILDEARRSKSHHEQNHHYAQYQKSYNIGKNPHTIAARSEEIAKIFTIINSQLPHHEARVVIERCYYSQNTDMTARNMCINKRTVSRYLCTGLHKIRQLLEEEATEGNSTSSCDRDL